jgi:hypothetical protein
MAVERERHFVPLQLGCRRDSSGSSSFGTVLVHANQPFAQVYLLGLDGSRVKAFERFGLSCSGF